MKILINFFFVIGFIQIMVLFGAVAYGAGRATAFWHLKKPYADFFWYRRIERFTYWLLTPKEEDKHLK